MAPALGCGAVLPNGDVLLLPSTVVSGSYLIRKFRADTLTRESTGVSVAEVGTGFGATTEFYSNPVVIPDTAAGGAACKIYHFAKSTDANQKSKLYTVSAAGAVTSVENLPQWPAANTSSSGVGPVAIQSGSNVIVFSAGPSNTSPATTAYFFNTTTRTWTTLATSTAYASTLHNFQYTFPVFKVQSKIFCMQANGQFAIYDVLLNTWTINNSATGKVPTIASVTVNERGNPLFKHPTLENTWAVRHSTAIAEILTFGADGSIACADAPDLVSNLDTRRVSEIYFGTVDGQKSLNLASTVAATNYAGTIKFFGEVAYGDPIVQAEKI
jgi:hypothetical protein